MSKTYNRIFFPTFNLTITHTPTTPDLPKLNLTQLHDLPLECLL